MLMLAAPGAVNGVTAIPLPSVWLLLLLLLVMVAVLISVTAVAPGSLLLPPVLTVVAATAVVDSLMLSMLLAIAISAADRLLLLALAALEPALPLLPASIGIVEMLILFLVLLLLLLPAVVVSSAVDAIVESSLTLLGAVTSGAATFALRAVDFALLFLPTGFVGVSSSSSSLLFDTHSLQSAET